MKLFFTIIGLFFFINSYSQSVFIPAKVHQADLCTVEDIAVYAKFINRFNTTDLRFVRIQNDVTAKWTSAFCDCELCHDFKTDSADFVIGIGDSCTTSCHFYPSQSKGSGLVKIKVFARNNRSVFVTGEFSASCTDASFSNLNKEQLIVSPNPASQTLSIKFNSGELYDIYILSAEGQVLNKENAAGINHTLDISHLAAGMYSVKTEGNGKVYFAKFIKI